MSHAVYVAVRWVDPEGECRCDTICPAATLAPGWAARICVDLAGPVSEWIMMGEREDLRTAIGRALAEEREFLRGECVDDMLDHEDIIDASGGEFPDEAHAIWCGVMCSAQWGVEIDLLDLAEDVLGILCSNRETLEKISQALLTEGRLDEERLWGLLDAVERRPDILSKFPLPQGVSMQ